MLRSSQALRYPILSVEPRKRGVVAFIMSALHASRRQQASRIMRELEHLLKAPKLDPETESDDFEQDGTNKDNDQIACPM